MLLVTIALLTTGTGTYCVLVTNVLVTVTGMFKLVFEPVTVSDLALLGSVEDFGFVALDVCGAIPVDAATSARTSAAIL